MKIIKDQYFKDITTFHIGGKIRYYAEVIDIKELEEVVSFAKKENLKIFIIGGGSDFLANDKEFDGLVIKYSGDSYSIKGNLIKAEAGMIWDELVEISVKNNLQGIECMSGIPGTVGASPVQNIGAYGQELADTFYKLTAFNIEKCEYVEFNKEDCNFGYRESIFKEKSHWQRYLIVNITLKLNADTKSNVNYESLKGHISKNSSLEEIRKAILEVRNGKLENPKEVGNAGSFFKNPIVNTNKRNELIQKYPDIVIYPFENKYKIFAGWLIEQAGWKGKTDKNAAVSAKHALILINKTGKATAGEVYDLSQRIIDDVNKKFGVKLEREVQLINF
jgi:UDP-N-acetylmuramate dehydrogenase